MSKRQLIILFAALIILFTLISGLRSVWSSTLTIILSLCIIAVAYTTTKPSQSSTKKSVNAPYVDAHGGATSAPAFRVPVESTPQATSEVKEETPAAPLEEKTN